MNTIDTVLTQEGEGWVFNLVVRCEAKSEVSAALKAGVMTGALLAVWPSGKRPHVTNNLATFEKKEALR